MTLFRNATDLDHWYVRVAGGWLRFPAGVNGWFAAQVVRRLDETHLRPVPVWLAFNTGMPLKQGHKADKPFFFVPPRFWRKRSGTRTSFS